MSELNMYNLYSFANNNVIKEDKVDSYVKNLMEIEEYDDVKTFVLNNFGDINGEKLIEYPELCKQVNVLVDEEKIEICVAKNFNQYWGKGWYLVEQ